MDKYLVKKEKREERQGKDAASKDKEEPIEEGTGKKLKTEKPQEPKTPASEPSPVKDSKTESTEVEAPKEEKSTKTYDMAWIDKLPAESADLVKTMTDDHWKSVLASEFKKPYFEKISKFLVAERAKGKKIYPPETEIFNAFNFTPLDKVKVVIIGQDPYHGPNQAHGLCFSVKKGVATPPSLVNIYKELTNDIAGFVTPKHGNLEKWAREGVFMLNATFTVEASQANSHKDIGWLTFTDSVMKILNKEKSNLVFILWGKFAQGVGKCIDKKKHCVIEAAHPSPLSATKFYGCKVFSKANKYLEEKGQDPIDWKLEA